MKNYIVIRRMWNMKPASQNVWTGKWKWNSVCLTSILYENPKKVLHWSYKGQNSIRIKWRKFKSFFFLFDLDVAIMVVKLLKHLLHKATKKIKLVQICVWMSVISSTILHHPQLIEKFQEHCLFLIPVQQNRYRIDCMIFILSLTFSLLDIPNSQTKCSVQNWNMSNEHNYSEMKRRPNLLCSTVKWNRCLEVFWNVTGSS